MSRGTFGEACKNEYILRGMDWDYKNRKKGAISKGPRKNQHGKQDKETKHVLVHVGQWSYCENMEGRPKLKAMLGVRYTSGNNLVFP